MYEKEIRRYLEQYGFGEFHPKAVLFDMYGVLYDSMPNHAYSWHHSMKGFGIDMTEADAYAFEGMRGVETIKILARKQWGREITDEESAMMYAEKSRVFATRPMAKVMEGVRHLQETIKACGLEIVVVTGSGQHSLLEKLTQDFAGLVSRDLIVSCFDVSRGKPHPEPYLKGMEKVGVKPWEAIVVENAPLGVRAAKAAGIFTFAVNTGPLPDGMLEQEGADVVVKRMSDVELIFEGR